MRQKLGRRAHRKGLQARPGVGTTQASWYRRRAPGGTGQRGGALGRGAVVPRPQGGKRLGTGWLGAAVSLWGGGSLGHLGMAWVWGDPRRCHVCAVCASYVPVSPQTGPGFQLSVALDWPHVFGIMVAISGEEADGVPVLSRPRPLKASSQNAQNVCLGSAAQRKSVTQEASRGQGLRGCPWWKN